MSHPYPSATAPLGDTEYWLTKYLLTRTDFTKKGLHNMLLKLKDPIERLRLIEAVYYKTEDSLCSTLPSADVQKRITVKIVGKDYRMFAGELTYKLFRHSKAQKKKLVIKCEMNEEAVCVNPYHYQFKDSDDNDVPDELSDNEKSKKNNFAYFPVVDVNELPERKECDDDKDDDEYDDEYDDKDDDEDDDKDDDEDEDDDEDDDKGDDEDDDEDDDKGDDEDDDFDDTEHSFGGAVKVLSSTALEEPDAELSSPCTSCQEKDAKIAELEEELRKCKVEIATMKKSGKSQASARQLPARAARKKY